MIDSITELNEHQEKFKKKTDGLEVRVAELEQKFVEMVPK